MLENKVDCYDIVGPSILHQDAVIDLITSSLLIPEKESIGYQRSVCGGMLEKSSSTLETPDQTGRWGSIEFSNGIGKFLGKLCSYQMSTNIVLI